MEFEILGWPADGPTLDLDHERFAYAGKFVMSSTGKAVARTGNSDDGGDSGDIVGAVAFNEDRTDEETCWLRYVTVHSDRRGEGIGSRLLAFTREALAERGYARVRIAVNNPFAFEACYRAGFRFTGEETGIAELVLEWSADDGTDGKRSAVAGGSNVGIGYADGLDQFGERDLQEAEQDYLTRARERGPPPRVDEDASSG